MGHVTWSVTCTFNDILFKRRAYFSTKKCCFFSVTNLFQYSWFRINPEDEGIEIVNSENISIGGVGGRNISLRHQDTVGGSNNVSLRHHDTELNHGENSLLVPTQVRVFCILMREKIWNFGTISFNVSVPRIHLILMQIWIGILDPHWKNWIRIRIQVMNISLWFTEFFTNEIFLIFLLFLLI